MSLENLKEALRISKDLPNYLIKGTSSKKVIRKAEKLLGYNLSELNKLFYEQVGYLSFTGFEFYGICKSDFSGKSEICAVETTLKERKENNLPKNLLLFCSFGDGTYGYLDYKDINSNGEPPLIMVEYNGKGYSVIEKISNDIGNYILECTKKVY